MTERKIKIVIDSSVDLTKEIIQAEDIDVLHYTVTVGDKTYKDGVNITTEELYKYVEKAKQLPKTAAINQAEFMEEFKKYPDNDIIFIGLGSGFSSTYSSAYIASQEYDNVYTIDSQNLSSGTGLLVLKICKYRKEGKSAKEIVELVNKLVPNVRSQFCINTLDFLHKGGRCSGVAALLGGLLKLKPIIKVVDNKMVVAKKPIGFQKALDAQLNDIVSHKDNVDLDCIMVTHSMANEDAKYLISELSKVFNCRILETFASGTISTHCGPRTIGILYIITD